MTSIHSHSNSYVIGSGRLKLQTKEMRFVDASIFLHNEDLEEQQRVCITPISDLDEKEIKSFANPFGTLILDKPFFIGNYPIKKLNVFLLSASITTINVDLLVSPKNEKIEKLFRSFS